MRDEIQTVFKNGKYENEESQDKPDQGILLPDFSSASQFDDENKQPDAAERRDDGNLAHFDLLKYSMIIEIKTLKT